MAQNLSDFEASQSEFVKELERQLTEKERILESYQKEHGKLEMFFDSIKNSISAIKPSKIKYERKETRLSSTILAVLQDTDWHIGATQAPLEIEGFNEYNFSVAQARVRDYTHRANRWIDRNR